MVAISGLSSAARLQQTERAVVARSGAYAALETLDCFKIVVDDIRTGLEHRAEVFLPALVVGDQDLDARPGLPRRNARMVAAMWAAPPSGRSSRATAVITANPRLSAETAFATRSGSSGSRGAGRAVVTSQNPQRRVQWLPPIMKVAVPRAQHSPRFGHAAERQTV